MSGIPPYLSGWDCGEVVNTSSYPAAVLNRVLGQVYLTV